MYCVYVYIYIYVCILIYHISKHHDNQCNIPSPPISHMIQLHPFELDYQDLDARRILFGFSKTLQLHPKKLTWSPKIWWFVDVSPFPLGCIFSFQPLVFGCLFKILLKSFSKKNRINKSTASICSFALRSLYLHRINEVYKKSSFVANLNGLHPLRWGHVVLATPHGLFCSDLPIREKKGPTFRPKSCFLEGLNQMGEGLG